MDLEAILLAKLGPESTNLIEGLSDLLDCLIARYILWKVIGLYLYTGATYVTAEFQVLLCTFDVSFEPFRVIVVEGEVGTQTYQFNGAVVKAFLHIPSLSGVKT